MRLPVDSELTAIARRVVWFEPPEQALTDGARFLAYAFRYATPEDMATLRRRLGDDRLRVALEHAPSGVIDERSWAYWRLVLDLDPRPLPTRQLA